MQPAVTTGGQCQPRNQNDVLTASQSGKNTYAYALRAEITPILCSATTVCSVIYGTRKQPRGQAQSPATQFHFCMVNAAIHFSEGCREQHEKCLWCSQPLACDERIPSFSEISRKKVMGSLFTLLYFSADGKLPHQDWGSYRWGPSFAACPLSFYFYGAVQLQYQQGKTNTHYCLTLPCTFLKPFTSFCKWEGVVTASSSVILIRKYYA